MRGRPALIRKVYEVDPLLGPQCGGTMKIIAFLIDFSVVDRIINHLKLMFVAKRAPAPRVAYQELLMAADLLSVMSPTIGFSWAMMTFIVPPCSSLRVQDRPSILIARAPE